VFELAAVRSVWVAATAGAFGALGSTAWAMDIDAPRARAVRAYEMRVIVFLRIWSGIVSRFHPIRSGRCERETTFVSTKAIYDDRYFSASH
jgi:hypothetical protein